MQALRDHVMEALKPKSYFNEHFLGETARHLGKLGYKDAELIKA